VSADTVPTAPPAATFPAEPPDPPDRPHPPGPASPTDPPTRAEPPDPADPTDPTDPPDRPHPPGPASPSDPLARAGTLTRAEPAAPAAGSPGAERLPLVDLGWQRDEVAAEVEAGFADVLARTAFVGGPHVAAFEDAFAAYCGAGACVGVANGTDALELALRAVGVTPGTECVLPANTFVATAEAVARAGGRPVLVDIDPATFLIDAPAAAAAIGERTAAVVPVHLYGRTVDVTPLRAAADRHGARIVEDAAQAHGARLGDHRAGALGHVGATSFYPGKNLGAYGDGGAVVTDDAELADRVRLLRSHGERQRYRHEVVGTNSRLDALQAVVLAAKLRRLDGWNGLRRAAALRYDELLECVAGVVAPHHPPGEQHVWHLYVVRVPRAERDRIVDGLHAAGIEAGIHYPAPVHLTPAFGHLGHGPGSFPHAERAAAEILSLPLFPGITAAQQERVVATLAGLL
jgi:dTDP-4-amino-4,6-dideoxygalactose transaminase